MIIRSRAFLLTRGGEGLNVVRNFISTTIGHNAFLIKNIETTSFNSSTNIINIIYQDYSDNLLQSISPKENYILSTGINSGNLYLNLLLNEPIGASFRSGAVVVDGSGLDTHRYITTGSSNGYSVKVNLSGFDVTGNHSYLIDSTKVRRPDGTFYPYSIPGGYTIHTHASPLASEFTSHKVNRRGEIAFEHVYLNNSSGVQAAINQFLANRSIDVEELIAYNFVNRDNNSIDLYIIYISDPEPQIIGGYPSHQSFIPYNRLLSKVRLTFSTSLSSSQLATQPGLFVIDTGFNTFYNVSTANILLLQDQRTVEINVTPYITAKGIYTIIANPGIVSNRNIAKQLPDHWTIIVDSYEGGSGSGDANMNDVMRRIAFRGMGA